MQVTKTPDDQVRVGRLVELDRDISRMARQVWRRHGAGNFKLNVGAGSLQATKHRYQPECAQAFGDADPHCLHQ